MAYKDARPFLLKVRITPLHIMPDYMRMDWMLFEDPVYNALACPLKTWVTGFLCVLMHVPGKKRVGLCLAGVAVVCRLGASEFHNPDFCL